MNKETTVRISRETRQLLDEVGKKIGAFGDTYDDILYKALKKIKDGDK